MLLEDCEVLLLENCNGLPIALVAWPDDLCHVYLFSLGMVAWAEYNGSTARSTSTARMFCLGASDFHPSYNTTKYSSPMLSFILVLQSPLLIFVVFRTMIVL